MLNFACEYGNCFLPSELTRSSRHSQERYSQPIWRPLSFRHLHPIMKSSGTCWTSSPRIFSVMNWKSRGGEVSSIVLTTDTLLSIERFLIKIRRRSWGDGCSGGTITAVIDLVEESPGFKKRASVSLSVGLELLRCNTIAETLAQHTRVKDLGSSFIVELISLYGFSSKKGGLYYRVSRMLKPPWSDLSFLTFSAH